MCDMRPISIVLAAAGLAIAIGSFALTWFTHVSGPNHIKIKPGEITSCQGDTCTTENSDNADYDSMWLGVTNAGKLSAGLGLFACFGGAVMAHSRKSQFGKGGMAIKKEHLMFAALIGLGLTLASLLMVPIGPVKAPGIIVALIGYAVGAAGTFLIKEERPQPNVARPMP